MIKPVLPPCSVAGCTRAAGAIINEALLCGEHAKIELDRVLEQRKGMRKEEGSNGRDEPQERTRAGDV